TAQVTAGYAPRSVVSNTGLALDQDNLHHINAGTLVFRGFIDSFKQHEVVLNGPGPNGSTVISQVAAVDELWHKENSTVPDMYRITEQLPGYATDISDQWTTPYTSLLWPTG